jgi:predicted dehydrogenase
MRGKPMRWGIFGTGAISAKFVAGLAHARDAEVAFVASRTLESAQRFVAGVGCGRPVAGYAQAAALGGVDAIYIATPPALHAEHALACIAAGIPVLIEKPMAFSAQDAQRIADAARARSVFAMEAMWTRFLPAAQALREVVLSRRCGDIRMVSGDFGLSQRPDPRNGMFDPSKGGGALAHLGAYPLSLGQWLLGEPQEVQALGTIGDTGVDETVAIQCRYAGDVLGSFNCSLRSWSDDRFLVSGTEASVGFHGSIVRPYGVRVAVEGTRGYDEARFGWRDRLRQNALVHKLAQRLDRSGRTPARHQPHHYAGNGYHYEVDEVRACIERGDTESTTMPLNDSIAVAATADRVRAALFAARA